MQDAVDDIRQGLVDLGETLKNINENPNVADDKEFTTQLGALSDDIDQLHDKATDLQSKYEVFKISCQHAMFRSFPQCNCLEFLTRSCQKRVRHGSIETEQI